MEKELVDVTKKSGIVFFGGIVGACLSFAFIFIVTQYLGARQYGRFVYLFTLISFFPLLCTLGFDKGLVYFISKMTVKQEIDHRNKLISLSFGITFIVSIAVTVLIMIVSNFIAEEILNREKLSFALTVSAPLIIFMTFTQMAHSIYRSIGRISVYVGIQNITEPLARIVAISIFIGLGFTLYGIIGAFYIGALCCSFLLLRNIVKLKVFTSVTFSDLKGIRDIFLYSLPLLVGNAIMLFGRRLDIMFIGYSISIEKVAVYKVAFQIGTMTNFALGAFNVMFASVITSLYYKGEIAKLGGLYKAITKWIVASNIMFFSIILLFSHDILRIFGEPFVAGSTALILVSVGQLFNVGVGSAGLINTMTGHPQYSLYISIGQAIVNIVLIIVLIPVYGINGAAFASLLSVGGANITRLGLVYRDLHIHPYNRSYLKVILSTAISYLIVLALKNVVPMYWVPKFFLLSFVFVVIFTGTIFLLGISDSDKIILDKILGKIKFNG
jgi:O-antigen/teichoic acid export membrane protein